MPLITREEKGSKLTIAEMDGNLLYLQAQANTAGFTQHIVTVPSESILTIADTPIEIFPEAVTTSSFYLFDWNSSYIQYEYGTTPYEVGPGSEFLFYLDAGEFYGSLSLATSNANVLSYSSNTLGLLAPYYTTDLISSAPTFPLTSLPLKFVATSQRFGGNPSGGDGSLQIVLYYKEITLGS